MLNDAAGTVHAPRATVPHLTATARLLTHGPVRNLLLASLPKEALGRVRPHLESVRLEQGEQLFEADAPIRHVYFPETAIISVARRLSDGETVEVGTAGCEGMVGLTLFLAGGTSPFIAFAQLAGVVNRIGADAFTLLASAPGALHRVLLRYAEAFLSQVAQTAACNATHLVEERCARWLLTTQDRVDSDTFPLVQTFLASTLGVGRAGVTVAMHDFHDVGMVQLNHGEVQVLDRVRLEGASCECYRAVRAHYDQLIPLLRQQSPS